MGTAGIAYLHKNQPNHGSQIQGADWEILVLWMGWLLIRGGCCLIITEVV